MINHLPNFRIALTPLHPHHIRRARRRVLWLWLLMLGWIVLTVWFTRTFGIL